MKQGSGLGSMLAALAVMFSACSFHLERPPQPALHDLGPSHQLRPQAAGWSAVTVVAPEWLKDSRIRYRLRYADPTQVRFYALDRWVAPPPELLAQRLASLGTRGASYDLVIELQEFEQIFERPGSARVVMRLRVTAREKGDSRALGERIFELGRPTVGANAIGAVEGWSRLASDAADQLSQWVSELPPAR